MHPEAGSQGASALWLGPPHHLEETAAPRHIRKVSRWRRVSPPHPEGEREVLALSPVSLIGNGGVSGAWPIGIQPPHSFHLFGPSLAISRSTCLHRSRCIGAGGISDRSLLHWWLLGGSLLWSSGSHPHTRPAGAYPWAFGLPVRLLSRLTWLQLRPPGQWCPNQVGALLDLASLNKQPMEVAPSFYPEGELHKAVKVEASSLLKLLGDICHVVQRVLLLNSDRLSLPGSEVVEEAFPHPNPLCFPVWSLDGVPVVDLEHMLKVSSPSTGSILSSHLSWSGMGMMAGLEMRVSQGCSQGSSGCYPSSPSRATGQSASEAPFPSLLPAPVRVGRVSGRSSSI